MTIDLSLLVIILLVASLSLNVLLVWFLRGLTSRLVLVSDNMSDLVDYLAKYGSNLKSIYDMELYYGDETIKGLVKHTQMILEVLSDFEEIYVLTDNDEEETEEIEEEEDLEGDTAAEPPKEEEAPQVQRKAVFHSGT